MQSNFTSTTCRLCGMTYAPGQETDEKLHQTFHTNLLQGIRSQVNMTVAFADKLLRSRASLLQKELCVPSCCREVVSHCCRAGKMNEWSGEMELRVASFLSCPAIPVTNKER